MKGYKVEILDTTKSEVGLRVSHGNVSKVGPNYTTNEDGTTYEVFASPKDVSFPDVLFNLM